jgi:hypothetical protein
MNSTLVSTGKSWWHQPFAAKQLSQSNPIHVPKRFVLISPHLVRNSSTDAMLVYALDGKRPNGSVARIPAMMGRKSISTGDTSD